MGTPPAYATLASSRGKAELESSSSNGVPASPPPFPGGVTCPGCWMPGQQPCCTSGCEPWLQAARSRVGLARTLSGQDTVACAPPTNTLPCVRALPHRWGNATGLSAGRATRPGKNLPGPEAPPADVPRIRLFRLWVTRTYRVPTTPLGPRRQAPTSRAAEARSEGRPAYQGEVAEIWLL